MNHLVNSLKIYARCEDEATAFDVRNNFSTTLKNEINIVIDEVISEYGKTEKAIVIDKIEIDIDISSLALTEFQNYFRSVFEKELVNRLHYPGKSTQVLPLQLYRANALQYFLSHGTMPWWLSNAQASFAEIEQDSLKDFSLLHSFLKDNASDIYIWQRAAFQLNSTLQNKIIDSFDILKNVKQNFIGLLQKLETFLFIKNILAIQKNGFLQTLNSLLLNYGPYFFNTSLQQQDYLLKDILQQNISELFENISIEELQSFFYDIKNSGDNAVVLAEILKKENIESIKTSQQNNIEKLIIADAGILLLAPFFVSFFKNQQLLADGKWITKEAQYKAIHLLKFLSTGQWKSPEYNLAFEKICCGFNLDEPVPLCVNCDAADETEAESLLSSVIAHWKILKNTSVTGLRQTFLQREGIVTRKDGDWKLQVERKTWDVMLDSIPWGFSTVTLPWNKYFIYTEW